MANPRFCRGDLDGFFGLFIDNLVQLLSIVALLNLTCGIAPDSPLLTRAIFPGAAASILLGNLFYAWQARRLAKRENRNEVTALPYGINTPSLLIFVFFVMAPAYNEALQLGVAPETAAHRAWQMGLLACFGSGLIEFAGAFVAASIRRVTPRAALLSTLAGIAIGFISMTFALQIFQRPLVAMPPLAVILISYFAHARFPLAIPGGLLAILLGTGSAWFLVPLLPPEVGGPPMVWQTVAESWSHRGLYWPTPAWNDLATAFANVGHWGAFIGVVIPMGLFNVIGSLQNVESAEAGGDSYDTRSSLAANGIGTLIAAGLGSCFPTTIYIGHPGWKALGARSGYSTLNGVVVAVLCVTGLISTAAALIPLEAGVAILLWIGIIITAQAYQTTPVEHAPAVAVGLFPAIAAFGWTVTQGAFLVAGGKTVQSFLDPAPVLAAGATVNGFLIHGMIALERGYILTGMILSAIAASLIDRRFYTASLWSLVAFAFTLLGIMHAYQLMGNSVDHLVMFQKAPAEAVTFQAWGIAIGYAICSTVFAGMGRVRRNNARLIAAKPSPETTSGTPSSTSETALGLGESDD